MLFTVYEASGFKFYEGTNGKIYISNLQEMILSNGIEMTEDCLEACELYNSTIKI